MKALFLFAFFLVVATSPLTALETDDAVKRLQTGEKPDAHDQDFWRRNYEAWLESERTSPIAGDQSLGKALYDLSEGRSPDDNGTDAVLHLYNVSKSQAGPADNSDVTQPDTGTKPGLYSPPPEPGSSRPLIAVMVAFIAAVAVMAVAAKVVHRKR